MADFDDFADPNQNNAALDDDPAADFLAREQSELAGLEDDGLGGGAPAQNDDDFNSFGGDGSGDFNQPAAQTNGPADAYAAVSQVDRQRQEPETIRQWREEQKKRLETKDREEEERRQELKAKAAKELEDWYKHHSEQLEKTRESNRAAERAMVQERDETAPGHEWERICRLCEFNPKNSKSTKDVSRMRSILLQLKQTPLVR